MKLWQLEEQLEEVEGFEKPNVKLEQYPTSAHIAAHMLFTIDRTYEEIQDRVIADLGCGCGILGIGAALLGSGSTIGFEIDENAIAIAVNNNAEMETSVEFVQCDVSNLCLAAVPPQQRLIDTVIMNPPFGTKFKGIDMVFLQKALQMARVSVYSLHKTSTREHIERKARQWGAKGEVLAELRYDIPAMYRFHKKQSVDIEVDFWRFEILSSSPASSASSSATAVKQKRRINK